MQVLISKDNDYILRLEQGEELIAQLTSFCRDENISAASFYGLGACSRLILSSYNTEAKNYNFREFRGDMEIASLVGNVSISDGEIVVHAHGTFGDTSLVGFAGHVKLAVISATCEIQMRVCPGELIRTRSEEIGINLLTKYKS